MDLLRAAHEGLLRGGERCMLPLFLPLEWLAQCCSGRSLTCLALCKGLRELLIDVSRMPLAGLTNAKALHHVSLLLAEEQMEAGDAKGARALLEEVAGTHLLRMWPCMVLASCSEDAAVYSVTWCRSTSCRSPLPLQRLGNAASSPCCPSHHGLHSTYPGLVAAYYRRCGWAVPLYQALALLRECAARLGLSKEHAAYSLEVRLGPF